MPIKDRFSGSYVSSVDAKDLNISFAYKGYAYWRPKMGAITLSVPDELKSQMDRADWINWSSIARRAFSETLSDIRDLEARKKIRELSEIDEGDRREVKESVAQDVVRSIRKTASDLKSGKKKAMTAEEFKDWSGSL